LKLKELRKQKGYSQAELAEGVKMNRSFLAQIESGKAKMPQNYVEKLCVFLNVSEEELSDEPETKKIDGSILTYAIEIIDSVTDASDLTKKQRLNLIHHAYQMIEEVFEKKLTTEQIEQDVEKIKQEVQKEVFENQERKNSIFKILKKSST